VTHHVALYSARRPRRAFNPEEHESRVLAERLARLIARVLREMDRKKRSK
jgi:hypothetical protein